MRTVLVTGGAGFIGSHVVRRLLQQHDDLKVVNLDALTYAGNLENLADLADNPRYVFHKADITDMDQVQRAFEAHKPDGVIHLAAESHVDRSILNPMGFIHTNVVGTAHLMNAARALWQDRQDVRFYHVSTDEVYGSLGETGYFLETTPYDPRSPYSASKASSDHLVRAYYHTFKLPIVITNCSNNYGPNQFPEKLIPLMITKIQQEEALPVYGKGDNIRDWLYVEDHAAAIDLVYHQGTLGETYNIGGRNEWQNIELVRTLCRVMDEKLGRPEGSAEKRITFVTDRPGHDQRYAIDCAKIERELGWTPATDFENGLRKTVDWYLANDTWVQHVLSGEYQAYYTEQYGNRLNA